MNTIHKLNFDTADINYLGCAYGVEMIDHFKLFEPIIWLMVQQYNSTEVNHSRKKLKEALKDTLKKMTDWPVYLVSQSVLDLCNEKGINPFHLLWPQRNILGKYEGKSMLVWEHTTPLSQFFETLVSCNSIEEVGRAIENYSGVCWITREEDNRLNKIFKQKRPNGWQSAYKQCGINVVYRK